MKCKKEKCEYYTEHKYNKKIYMCSILFVYTNYGHALEFYKNKNNDCIIDDIINSKENQLKDLKNIKKDLTNL